MPRTTRPREREYPNPLRLVYYYRRHRKAAYEAAVEQAEIAGNADATSLMTIAQIHYGLHQYQQALDYAIEYLKTHRQPSAADYVFVDRLRELAARVR